MNYRAFPNDSLIMMYEGVQGALAGDGALERDHREPRFVSARRPTGNSTPPIWNPKCSDAK